MNLSTLQTIKLLRQPAVQPGTEKDWQRRSIRNKQEISRWKDMSETASINRKNIIKQGKQTTEERIIHYGIDLLNNNDTPTEVG